MKKILALLSFVSLVSLFVLYRGGAFDKYLQPGTQPLQTSPNGGPVDNSAQAKKDTIVPISDSLRHVMKQRGDSLAAIRKADSVLKNQIMWSGSKSGRAISAYDLKLLEKALLKDSLPSAAQLKTDTSQKEKGSEPKRIMSSSKSAGIFRQEDLKQLQRNDELIRLFKIYAGDSAGLRRALERHFRPRQ